VANQQRFTGTEHTAILGIRKIYLARPACTKQTSAAVRFAPAAAVATIPASDLSHAIDRSPRYLSMGFDNLYLINLPATGGQVSWRR
jgi:hypothetical protein